MTQLDPVEDYEAFYDQELSSPVENAPDPFMARDLDVDTTASVAGRILKRVADDESYDLEVVDNWPYVFSREGKTNYVQTRDSPYSEESVNIGRRIIQILETEGAMDEEEVEEVTNYLVADRRNISTKMHRQGETRDLLRETPEVDYSMEEKEFKWNP